MTWNAGGYWLSTCTGPDVNGHYYIFYYTPTTHAVDIYEYTSAACSTTVSNGFCEVAATLTCGSLPQVASIASSGFTACGAPWTAAAMGTGYITES